MPTPEPCPPDHPSTCPFYGDLLTLRHDVADLQRTLHGAGMKPGLGDKVDARIQKLEERVDRRFEDLDRRISRLLVAVVALASSAGPAFSWVSQFLGGG